MKKKFIIIFALCSTMLANAQSVWEMEHLANVRQKKDTPFYAAAYKALIAESDKLLDTEAPSVMDKPYTPASGSKHDYMSIARYSWPDPSKPDGLPYITRDGRSNPELYKYDREPLGRMANAVTTLSLAWYFSGDERYAQKAVSYLNTWFLDKRTMMNPNLNYAQVIRGQDNDRGRSYGVIDSYSFVEMLDAVQLLQQSRSFPKKDRQQLKKWFSRFTQWLLTSPLGKQEAKNGNNHAVAYDTQVAAYALFIGDKPLAQKILSAVPEKRIYTQIEPDGRQPHELRRTLAFHYSQYNIGFFVDLALMGKKIGLDMAGQASADGRSMLKAVDYLTSYLVRPADEWPYKQISDMEGARQSFCRQLYKTAKYLGDPDGKYMAAYMQERIDRPADRFRLVYEQPTLTDEAYAFAAEQLRYAITCADKAKRDPKNAAQRRVTPRSLRKDGSLAMVGSYDWCSGFFAGSLWQMYEYTHDQYWREQAISWTWPIEDAKLHTGTHDLGFMIGDSFGKAWELTGEQSYRDVMIRASKSLITRFRDNIGCIRSWDHNRDKWQYPVIIDNMMNLEMLFKTTQLTGDSTYWKIAVRHADTTLKNHFRPDGSSFHVVDYDMETGKARIHCTHQGYSDDSFWSRGQGWAVYGYTMCYRFTHDKRYLDHARKVARFIFSLPNTPADGIFYWDMKEPRTLALRNGESIAAVPRDASSAALVASAFYELAQYVAAEEGRSYRQAADKILQSLHDGYESKIGENQGFLLLHSTGHHPGCSEIDVPINYADYYYLEALRRKAELAK